MPDSSVGGHLDLAARSEIVGGFGEPVLVRAAQGDGQVLADLGRVFGFTKARGKIVEIELVADPERPGRLDLAILDD